MAEGDEVTGGDLHNLWLTAHTAIPEAENIYTELTEIHDKELADGNEGTYGPVYDVWHILQQIAQLPLFKTGLTLRCSRLALDLAIAEYLFVDGDSAKGVSEAGARLAEVLADPDMTPPEVKPDGDPVGPDGGGDNEDDDE